MSSSCLAQQRAATPIPIAHIGSEIKMIVAINIFLFPITQMTHNSLHIGQDKQNV